MLQYLKLLIIALFSAVFAALPASGSGHFTVLNYVLNFTSSKNDASFYLSVIYIVFGLCMLFFLRRIYFKSFKVLKSKNASAAEKKNYRSMHIGLIISAVSGAVLAVPYSKGKLLGDIFSSHLVSTDMFVVAVASIMTGLISVTAIWYSAKKDRNGRPNSSIVDIIRMSIYSMLSAFFPGMSRFSIASNSLIVNGVEESVVIRDVMLYSAPAIIVGSVVRLIRSIFVGVHFDLIMFIICVAAAFAGSLLSLNLIKKVNVRSILKFFCAYNIIFGTAVVAAAFLL